MMSSDESSAWLVAALLVLLPWTAGLSLGRSLRRISSLPRRRILVVLSCAALLAMPLVALPRWPYLSLYDALLAAALFDGALLLHAWPALRRPAPLLAWLASGALLLAGLYGVELWAEAHPPARTYGISKSLRFFYSPEQHDVRASTLYATANRFVSHRHHNELPPPTSASRVLHLGDSMLAGWEVPVDSTFTALLQRERPDETDYNLGVDATGPDYQYAQLQRLYDAIRPTLIVQHVFPGNDVSDIDRPYVFCDGAPLLTDDVPPRWRCPEPRWRIDLHELLRFGPPPYPLRVSAQRFALAERFEFWFEATLSHIPELDVERNLRRLRDILAATAAFARDRGVPYRVVVLPVRPSFFYERFVPRERVVQAVRDSGVDFFDVGPDFAAAMAAHPERRWFQPAPANPHFDVDGHRYYADWLAAHVLPAAAAHVVIDR